MSAASLLTYAAVVVIAVATPGPAMMALIARGLARGSRAALRMALGIAVGDVVLGTLALIGLAALMGLYSWLFVVLKYLAALYLVWLGVRMWRAPPVVLAAPQPAGGRDLAVGLLVALSNPKAILFHASLMPLLIDLKHIDWPTGLLVLSIIFIGNLSVMSGYALATGAGARRLRSRWLDRVAGGVMIGTGSLIAAH